MMLNPNDISPGTRVLDSDGDFIGTVIDAGSDYVRMRSDGKIDGEHDVPLSRFSRADGDAIYLDGPWSTVLTSVENVAADAGQAIKGAASDLGGLAAGAAATVGGLASSAAHATERAADRVGDGIHDAVNRDHHHDDRADVGAGGKTNIWPWLLIGGAAIAAFLAFRSCSTEEAEAPVPPPVETSAPATAVVAEKVMLPDNSTLDIMPGTITYDLYKFVSGSDAAPKTFTFDKLNFDTGSAAIRAEDQPTIDSIAVILKAYPNVTGSIVGYTDSTGDAAVNAKLSADRSSNVMKAIVAKGVATSRLSAKAGGVAETTGGADQNARRTDLVVLAK